MVKTGERRPNKTSCVPALGSQPPRGKARGRGRKAEGQRPALRLSEPAAVRQWQAKILEMTELFTVQRLASERWVPFVADAHKISQRKVVPGSKYFEAAANFVRHQRRKTKQHAAKGATGGPTALSPT